MATPIPFALFNDDGTPNTTAVPVFLVFSNKAGTARSQPAISRFSGGQYEFDPSDADETAGTVYLIDCGVGVSPRYVYGEIHTDDNTFLTLAVFTEDGALGTGAPTVGVYIDGDDNARPAPTPTMVGAFAYLYTLTPTLEDVQIGTSYRIDGAASTIPQYLAGLFYNPDATDPPGPGPDGALGPAGVSIEDAIRAWVLAGTEFDEGQVIFTQQTGARPLTGAFATIRIGGSTPVGAWDEVTQTTDLNRDAGEEIEMRVEALRELPVSVQFFGPTVVGNAAPRELAERTQLALGLPSVRTTLDAAGLSPFDVGTVKEVTMLNGTKFEGRALLECRFYVCRTLSEFAGYIETVVTRNFMGPPNEGTAEEIDI